MDLLPLTCLVFRDFAFAPAGRDFFCHLSMMFWSRAALSALRTPSVGEGTVCASLIRVTAPFPLEVF